MVLFASAALAVLAGPHEIQATTLPRCSQQPLTAAPLKAGGYTNILPLGNLNPSDHTIPTDHLYFMLKGNYPDPPAMADAFAPGNVRITNISQSSAY